MNFIEAIKCMQDGHYMRRPSWQDGIAAFILDPNKSKSIYDSHYHQNQPYVATCHITACELGGVRKLDDILADDWTHYF